MKEQTLHIELKNYTYEELCEADRQLTDAAREATYRSYAPYSHFSVGAAARLAERRQDTRLAERCRKRAGELKEKMLRALNIIGFGKVILLQVG